MKTKIQDLKAPDVSGKNKIEAFELALAFSRINVVTFWGALVDAKNACGNESYVTLEELQKCLDSPAWAPLKDCNSTLSKIILSGHFKNPEESQTEEQIDFNILATFAVLLCQGKPESKAEVIFNILQEGGLDEHADISAEDKDFAPFWKNILKFATVYMFQYAEEHGGIDNKFKD